MRVRRALNLWGLRTSRVKHGRTEMTKSLTTVFNNLEKEKIYPEQSKKFDSNQYTKQDKRIA